MHFSDCLEGLSGFWEECLLEKMLEVDYMCSVTLNIKENDVI